MDPLVKIVLLMVAMAAVIKLGEYLKHRIDDGSTKPVGKATSEKKKARGGPGAIGKEGEALVVALAKQKLPTDVYVALHDVTLPCHDGTTQIDHLFVSRFGVFVVETKHMRGWIFGSERQPKWTVRFPDGSTYRMQNPLRQNYKHLKTLEETIAIPPEALKSVVVFTGKSTVKTEMPDNVTDSAGLMPFIRSFDTAVLSDEQVRKFVERIEAVRLPPGAETDALHIKNLEARFAKEPSQAVDAPPPPTPSTFSEALSPDQEPEEAADLPISGLHEKCPVCSKTMMLVTLKNSEHAGTRFWACTTHSVCGVVKPFEGHSQAA